MISSADILFPLMKHSCQNIRFGFVPKGIEAAFLPIELHEEFWTRSSHPEDLSGGDETQNEAHASVAVRNFPIDA